MTEGCHSNFFIVKNNKLITHPADHFILHGITRHYVITLAKELHIDVEEREFSLQEVYDAEECFFTATPLEIFPVVQIGDEQFGAGEESTNYEKLQVAYEESIRLFKVTN